MRNAPYRCLGAVCAAILTAAACGGSKPSTPGSPEAAPATAPAGGVPAEAEEPLPPSDLDTQLPPAVREAVLKPFTGDFDQMIERKVVRVGVLFNRTFYFVDKGVQRGVAYDYGQLMETKINEKLKNGNVKVHVFFVPMAREKLIPALIDGQIDLVAGHMTITPERQKLVDFSNPTRSNVNEILVTPADAPPVASVEDLAGKSVYVRKSASYYDSLLALNDQLKAKGKEPVRIELARKISTKTICWRWSTRTSCPP